MGEFKLLDNASGYVIRSRLYWCRIALEKGAVFGRLAGTDAAAARGGGGWSLGRDMACSFISEEARMKRRNLFAGAMVALSMIAAGANAQTTGVTKNTKWVDK